MAFAIGKQAVKTDLATANAPAEIKHSSIGKDVRKAL